MSVQVKRVERGWAGHFICGHDCRFRRNTMLVKGRLRIIVSTVGNMVSPSAKKAGTIGHERYYETMVFYARRDAPYWEIDVEREIQFKSEWAIAVCEKGTDLKADAMHEKVVAEIAKQMRRGNL